MRVLSYNILEGFQTFPERRKPVLAWIASMKPDILALQEINGYTSEMVSREARAWNHPHSVLLKDDGYSTAITSRTPITDEQRVRAGFQHGMLHARTAGIDVFVVHLNPFECEWRLREAMLILSRVGESLRAGRPVLVMGDFNTLSPTDREFYATASDVLDHQLWADREKKRSNTRGGQLDFRVLQAFVDAGLIDLVASKTNDTRERLSFPTALISPDIGSEAYQRRCLRLDYILASPDLAARCREAKVVRDDATAMLSDHYPVIADFD
jgi:exodeoxyribonuclease-3